MHGKNGYFHSHKSIKKHFCYSAVIFINITFTKMMYSLIQNTISPNKKYTSCEKKNENVQNPFSENKKSSKVQWGTTQLPSERKNKVSKASFK